MHSKIVVGAAALLLSWPVAAQQAAPQTPPSSTPAAPRGPGPMMGGQGPGSMMGGGNRPNMRDMMDEDDDNDGDRGRRMHGWHHRGGGDTPTQIIINIGPNNRVQVQDEEDRRFGDRGRMGQRAMRQAWAGRPADMVEGHLGYLRDALQLRPDQQPAWDRFAGAVREATGRMRQERMEAMSPAQGLGQRISEYEQALTSRLEAVRSVRGALSDLTGALDETQRRTLDQSAERLMGMGMGQMRGDRR